MSLYTADVANIRIQLFMGNAQYDAAKIQPILNRWRRAKPSGGIWTSTFIPETNSSAWLDWCACSGYRLTTDKNVSSILRVKDAARVLEIATYQDLHLLVGKYYNVLPSQEEAARILPPKDWNFFAGLDFEKMVADGWHGVHLTHRGERDTAYTHPGLSTWDCESTLWFSGEFLEYVGDFHKMGRQVH